MAYNIIEEHICYDFIIFLSKEIKKNLPNVEQGDFRYSSYLWWLIIDQHFPFFQKYGLKFSTPIFTMGNNPIDAWLPSLTMKNQSTYEFIKNFEFSTLRILISKYIPRVNPDTRDELQVEIEDWYLMKEQIGIMKYRFFDAPFLLPKNPPLVLLALEMGRQVVIFEIKYSSIGSFKFVYPIPTTMGTLIVMEENYEKKQNN